MIPELQNKILLSDIVKQKIKLVKKNNLLWGCCPFHKEKTPSFVVNDEKKFYHCFGCGAHGNVFNFLMQLENIDFPNVVRNLCMAYEIPYTWNKKDIHKVEVQQEITPILLEANNFYQEELVKHQEVMTYLENRGLSRESIKKFSLGYAPQSKIVTTLLQTYSIEQVKNSGIISSGTLDRLRNRVIFPILNEKQQPIAFAGRSLGEEQPKYINSSETQLFQKNLTLYNIHNIPYNSEAIFLVEGYMDVITMDQYGLSMVVSSMGTSVSKGQLFTIFRRTKNLYLVLDGDKSGLMAMDRTIDLILEMISPGYKVFIGILEEELDPDSFLRKYSVEKFKNSFIPLMDFLCNKVIAGLDLQSGDDLAMGFHKIDEQINKIKNKNIQLSYKLVLNNFIRKARNQENSSNYGFRKTTNYFQSKSTIRHISYIPSAEENIMVIILKYKSILEEHIEQLARVSFTNMALEKMKNQLILYINNNDVYGRLLEDYLASTYVQKIMEGSKSFLHREDFCRKYLWDLVCSLPII